MKLEKSWSYFWMLKIKMGFFFPKYFYSDFFIYFKNVEVFLNDCKKKKVLFFILIRNILSNHFHHLSAQSMTSEYCELIS